jgi:hypothetical protein
MTMKNAATPGGVETIRGLSLTAGNDVLIAQPVHVSDLLASSGEATLQPTTLSAGRSVTLGQLETIGPVTISAMTGNISVAEAIGAPASTPVLPTPWNPVGLGVASLVLSAPGSGAVISLQGARSVGNIVISAPHGTVNSAHELTSTGGGSVDVIAPTQSLSASALIPVPRLSKPPANLAVVTPSPLRAAPEGPLIPGAPPPSAPALPEILVSLPAGVDAGGLGAPAASADLTGDGTTIQVEAAARSGQNEKEAVAGRDSGADYQAAGALLVFSGGRGLAQTADLGRSAAIGSGPDVFSPTLANDEEQRRKDAK